MVNLGVSSLESSLIDIEYFVLVLNYKFFEVWKNEKNNIRDSKIIKDKD